MFPSGKCTSGGSATNEATPSSYIGYVSYLATQGDPATRGFWRWITPSPPLLWMNGEIWLETIIIVVLDYTGQKLISGLFEYTRFIIACRTEMTCSTPLNELIICLITASLARVAVLRRWVTISSFCQIYWTMLNLYLSKTAVKYSKT